MRNIFTTLFVTLSLLMVSNSLSAQDVRVNAFHHYIRWVNEINLPRYIKEKDVQDSIMDHAATLLARRFGNAKVSMPDQVYVDYIEVFGKAKMPAMKPATPGEIQVNLLTFVTRATTGFGVNWSTEVVAKKDGKTIYQKKIQHEIEYFSRSGYISSSVWYTPNTYIRLYKRLLDELLTDSSALPEKVTIGSIAEKEELIAEYVPGFRKAVVNARGNFMGGGNFSMTLSEGADTITRIRYRDGSETTQEWGPLGIGAEILKGMTGLDFSVKTNFKKTMRGKFFYEDGREIKLRIQFVGAGRRWTDGTREYNFSTAPAIVDAFMGNQIVGSMAYVNYQYPFETGNLVQQLPQTLPVGHSVRGIALGDSMYAEYEPDANIIRVFENKAPKVAVLLENAVEGSEYYSGQKMGKKKVTVTTAMGAQSKNEANEAYYFYYTPGLKREQLERYMDVILILLFCKGNSVV